MSLIVYAMRRWLWAWNRGMHPVQLRVAIPLLRLVREIICIAQLSYGVVLRSYVDLLVCGNKQMPYRGPKIRYTFLYIYFLPS